MIVKASTETVVVGAHVLKESKVLGFVGYAGVISKIAGQRVYHKRFEFGEVVEKWSHMKSILFVASSADDAGSFTKRHNDSILEVQRKVDGLRDVLMAEHAAMINAELGATP